MKWEGQSVDNIVWEGQSVDNVVFNDKVIVDNYSDDFISRWEIPADNTSFVFPVYGGVGPVSANYTVDWGDGSSPQLITGTQESDRTHVYATAGEYLISTSGLYFPGLDTLFKDEADYLREVYQMGNVGINRLNLKFYSCDFMRRFEAGPCIVNLYYDNLLDSFFKGSKCTDAINCKDLYINGAARAWSTFGDVTTDNLVLPKINPSTLTSTRYLFGSRSAIKRLDFNGLDIPNVTDIRYMLYGLNDLLDDNDLAPVADWTITNVTTADSFLGQSSLTTAIYDDLLVKWEAQSHQPNVSIDFGSSKYTAGGAAATARSALIADGWTISDGGTA
jgi:hypothetical protein